MKWTLHAICVSNMIFSRKLAEMCVSPWWFVPDFAKSLPHQVECNQIGIYTNYRHHRTSEGDTDKVTDHGKGRGCNTADQSFFDLTDGKGFMFARMLEVAISSKIQVGKHCPSKVCPDENGYDAEHPICCFPGVWVGVFNIFLSRFLHDLSCSFCFSENYQNSLPKIIRHPPLSRKYPPEPRRIRICERPG